jgi:hypothetical protein
MSLFLFFVAKEVFDFTEKSTLLLFLFSELQITLFYFLKLI